MKTPKIVINVYGGAAPCGCGGAKTVGPFVPGLGMVGMVDVSESPPGVIPPCGLCYWTLSAPGSIYVNLVLDPTIPGGPAITATTLTIFDYAMGVVGAVRLGTNGNASAGQTLSGAFTIPNISTRNAAQGLLSYFGSDGNYYPSTLPKR